MYLQIIINVAIHGFFYFNPRVMKKYILLLTLILIVGDVFSQDNILIPSVSSEGKWGAKNISNEVVVDFKYDKVSFYSFGYYLVEDNGKKGLIDSDGNLVLHVRYDAVRPIDSSRFIVHLNGKKGLFTKHDKEIIPIEFKTVLSRIGRNEIVVSKEAKYSLFSSSGEQLIPFEYDNISFYGDKYFLLRKGRKFAVSMANSLVTKSDFYDDVVRKEDFLFVRNNNKWGVLDKDLQIVIKPKYNDVKLIASDNFFLVQKGEKFALFNLEGDKISRYKFNSPIYNFDNNVCWYKEDGIWLRYDFASRISEDVGVSRIVDSLNGYIRVVRNNFVELVNRDEETLFSGKYQNIIPLNHNLFKVQYQRKWGVVNSYDEVLLDIKYEEIIFNTKRKESRTDNYRFDFEKKEEASVLYPETFTVKLDGKYGVYSLAGNELVPTDYQEVEVSVYNQLIRVKYKTGYNVYNREGTKLLENDYKVIDWNENQKYLTLNAGVDSVLAISDTLGNIIKLKGIDIFNWSLKQGKFFYNRDGFKGLLDVNLNKIIDFEYSKLYDLDERYFVGEANSNIYLFDINGENIFDGEIKSYEPIYVDNQTFFVVLSEKQYGVIDGSGTTIIPFEFSRIFFDKKHNLFRVEQNSKFKGYYNLTGEKFF